ncbi:MAG: CDP-alcohol phosphatidyltransferase family protein [Planctomycetota bacterium]|nr:MAG: CDP-alcohol phosphatidyltransferase family protein [Planctomycetota bacterium]
MSKIDRPAGFEWTIPNALCAIRLAGSPALLLLAAWQRADWFVYWYLFLAATDWVDGKLAIWLDQRSTFGARLDSWADAMLYCCLLLGGGWLLSDRLLEEWPWVAAAVGSYAVSTLAGFWKFGKWPSYHTRGAKISWFLITVGALCFLLDLSRIPFRIAMVSVSLTNVEATMITLVLPRWHADVLSLRVALRLARSDAAGEESDSQPPSGTMGQ